MPSLIYGTRLGGQVSVANALRKGYRAIDSGSIRTVHDEKKDGNDIQEALSNSIISRCDVLIQSKFSPWSMHKHSVPFNQDDDPQLQVLKSFSRSINDLQLDYLDVYYLHRSFQSMADTMVAWRMMEQLVHRGVVRNLGLSQVDYQCLVQVFDDAHVKPSVVQNRFTSHNAYDQKVIRFCAEHKISYQIFGLFREENRALLELPIIKEFADTEHVTPESALITLLLAAAGTQDLQLAILDGTRDETHMGGNLKADASKAKVATPINSIVVHLWTSGFRVSE